MQIFQWMKRAIEFVFDPEFYCLAQLAVRNHMRGRYAEVASSQREKKHAKAVNNQ